MKASRLEGQNSFESIVKKCIKNILLEVLDEKERKKDLPYAWLTYDMITEYHAQSMCFLVIAWIKNGMNISAREMADVYNYMIKHSVTDVVTEL